MNVDITPKAKKEIRKLPKHIGQRIFAKIYWFAAHDDPLEFAEPLTNSPYGGFRFRIGKYRVFFDVTSGIVKIMIILHVRKRNEKTYKQ